MVTKLVKDLKVGDVLTGSGALILEAPFDQCRTKPTKTNLTVQYPNGKKKLVEWNKRTQVSIKEN